jgi:hypothetical protein
VDYGSRIYDCRLSDNFPAERSMSSEGVDGWRFESTGVTTIHERERQPIPWVF